MTLMTANGPKIGYARVSTTGQLGVFHDTSDKLLFFGADFGVNRVRHSLTYLLLPKLQNDAKKVDKKALD
jgi:hypothetical protein